MGLLSPASIVVVYPEPVADLDGDRDCYGRDRDQGCCGGQCSQREEDPGSELTDARDQRGQGSSAESIRPKFLDAALQSVAAEAEGDLLHAVARDQQAHAKEAGLPNAERITGHSLRAGNATEAHCAGVPIARIAAQTRHKDLSVLFDRYIRPVDALEFSFSKDLGL